MLPTFDRKMSPREKAVRTKEAANMIATHMQRYDRFKLKTDYGDILPTFSISNVNGTPTGSIRIIFKLPIENAEFKTAFDKYKDKIGNELVELLGGTAYKIGVRVPEHRVAHEPKYTMIIKF